MKNNVLAGFIAVAFVAPAALAGDKVNVSYEGNSARMDVGDLKTTSVCSLKQQVAKKFGLKLKKFDLKKKHGTRLSADKTLYGAGVRNHNALEAKAVNHSSQC